MNKNRPPFGSLESDSVLPLYMQITKALSQRIVDGDYSPHEQLPSEGELMKMFGVSRITVRQALRVLHSDGLVFSVQGKGTFVSKPKVVQDVQRLQGFGESMVPKGYETATRVISLHDVRPPQEVAEALDVKKNDTVLELKRIRYLNRQPIALDHSFYPAAIGQKLVAKDLTQDIFPLLENEFHVRLDYADLRIEAALAEDEHVTRLGCKEGDPILLIRRRVFDESGDTVAFEYLSYRGDTFQYHLRADRR